MKNNSIPKGIVPLEDLFDKNDVAKNPKVTPNNDEVKYFNISTDVEPKRIKLSKALDLKNRQKCVTLMKEFSDVFAWSYDDLKEYDTDIIQHSIWIKKDKKPFRKKLRRIDPLVLPLIEKEIRKFFDAKIIVSLRFSKWLANIVLVRKGQGRGWGWGW